MFACVFTRGGHFSFYLKKTDTVPVHSNKPVLIENFENIIFLTFITIDDKSKILVIEPKIVLLQYAYLNKLFNGQNFEE